MGAEQTLLVADIGGTSSRFATFEINESKLEIVDTFSFLTAEISSFGALLERVQQEFLDVPLGSFSVIAFAVAGPIENESHCSAPNIQWTVDIAPLLTAQPKQKVLLINDFVAQAFATVSDIGQSYTRILPGGADSTFPRAVLGVGTGLGKAALVGNESEGFVSVASEGGHSSFSIESVGEAAFLEFMLAQTQRSYVEWEDVLSGRGLELIHLYCTGEKLSASSIAAKLASNEKTVEMFAKILGRMCRNFVLEFMARGGLYLAGGVLVKNPLILQCDAFESSFRRVANSRISIADIPVFLVDQEDSGLWGAATYGHKALIKDRS